MRLLKSLITLTVVLTFFTYFVNSQTLFRNSIFTDRDRRQETCPSCILLKNCPTLLRKLELRTRKAIYEVQDAICGYEGQNAKVCCPVPEEPKTLRGQRLLPTTCGSSAEFVRIYGGRNTSLGLHPWIAAFGYIRPPSTVVEFHCSGTLINDKYILTAAHCLDPGTLRGRRLHEIRLGDWDLMRENDCQERNATEICAPPFIRVEMETAVLHPTYGRRFQYSDDIALIRLSESLDLSRISPMIHPICLPPSFSPGLIEPGQLVTAVGWGMTEDGELSDILQQVELPIVDGERCKENYGPAFVDKQICAGGVEGEDTCSGDSGGPLIISRGLTFTQVGIVSFGLSVCGTNNTPAVYTDVREYKTWILENLMP